MPGLFLGEHVETAGKRQHESDEMVGQVLVVDPSHVGHLDIAGHQLGVEPVGAEPGEGCRNPLQPLGPGEQFRRQRAVDRVRQDERFCGVGGVLERFHDAAGHDLADQIGPVRFDVRGEQHHSERFGHRPILWRCDGISTDQSRADAAPPKSMREVLRPPFLA